MRAGSRSLLAVVALVALLAIPGSSHAQFAGTGGGSGSGAVALVAQNGLRAAFIAFGGAEWELSTDFQGARQYVEGCAELYDEAAAEVDFGCGEFEVVEISRDLSAATVEGTIASEVYDFETDESRPSTLTIRADLVAAGDLVPFAEVFELADLGIFGPTPFVFVIGGGFVELDRVATGHTSIDSAELGEATGEPTEAVLFEGAGLGAGVFV